MISARALVERHKKTELLAQFFAGEWPRSMQLYGTDPHYTAEATRVISWARDASTTSISTSAVRCRR
ncbi:MAG: tRNA-dihydrouridine synthase [Planctomycetota bacterium]